jgi:class 3 adenylate cyclase
VQTHVSVFYADIQGFTTICETLDADVLSKTLRLYFKRMTRLVLAHGGIVDKFIGDCIQAVWGAPFKVARDELLCALCALAFRKEASRNPLKKTFADLGFTLNVRIGVASGNVLAGNMGSKNRVAYTVVGEANTTANAIEPYCKAWGTYVACSEETARECNDELVFRLLTRAKFVGRAKPVLVYEIMGVQPDAKARMNKSKKRKRGGQDPGDLGSGSGSGNSGENASGSGSGSDEGDSNSSPTASSNGDSGSHSFSESKSNSNSEMNTSLGSGSSGGEELLPTNVNLESLLKWHKKRTAADERTIAFASQFNEISRCMMDSDFEGALQRHRILLEDDYLLPIHKAHKSVDVILDLIQRAMKGDDEISTNKNPLTEDGDFFVVVK